MVRNVASSKQLLSVDDAENCVYLLVIALLLFLELHLAYWSISIKDLV